MTQINKDQSYQKPSKGAIFGGVLAGSAVQSIIPIPNNLIAPKLMDKMAEISKDLTADEFSSAERAINTTINHSGLAKKGVSIVQVTKNNYTEISNIMLKEMDNNVILKFLPEKIKRFVGDIFGLTVKNGQNTFYTLASKKIIMPKKGLKLCLFHEMGHAANQNLSKIGKALLKCRQLAFLVLPISFIALCKIKKAPDEKPKGTVDKTTTFIENNAGKLTFAAMLPMLIEEGMASIKGINFAKEAGLSKELLAKVAKTNKLGYLTYLGSALATSIGIYLGVKVKNAIAKPIPVNHNKKEI